MWPVYFTELDHDMTDLATRIADVKKKAEAAQGAADEFAAEAKYGPEVPQHIVIRHLDTRDEYRADASPDLFIEMADEIDRLTASLDATRNKALDEAAAAIDNVDPMLADVILALKSKEPKP